MYIIVHISYIMLFMKNIWSLLLWFWGFFSGSKQHPWFRQSSKAFSQPCRSLPLHIITPEIKKSRFDSKLVFHLFCHEKNHEKHGYYIVGGLIFQVCCNSTKQFLHVPFSTCSKKLRKGKKKHGPQLSQVVIFVEHLPQPPPGSDDIHPKPPWQQV